jgi:hypothetical protein
MRQQDTLILLFVNILVTLHRMPTDDTTRLTPVGFDEGSDLVRTLGGTLHADNVFWGE